MEKTAKQNKSVRAVPEGLHTVTPYLVSDEAQKLIDFIKAAFNGKETYKTLDDNGKIMHATVKVGDSTIMISDTMDGMEPETSMLYLYLEDVNKVYQQALNAKARSVREPKDEFYGDRSACVKDPFNNTWWIATHVEDVSQDEIERRKKQFLKQGKEQRHEAHV